MVTNNEININEYRKNSNPIQYRKSNLAKQISKKYGMTEVHALKWIEMMEKNGKFSITKDSKLYMPSKEAAMNWKQKMENEDRQHDTKSKDFNLEKSLVKSHKNAASTKTGRDVLNAFKEANDITGNAVLSIAMTPAMLKNAATIGNLLTSGQIGTVASGIVGSVAGATALEKSVEKATGKPYSEHMRDAGMNSFNTMITHPGAFLGGTIGSGMYSGVKNNMYSGTQGVRQVYGPQGPVVVEPGQTYTFKTSTPTGYSYTGNYTGVKSGTGRGQGNGWTVSSGGRTQGKSTSYGRSTNVETKAGKQISEDIYSNPILPFVPVSTMWTPIPTVLPEDTVSQYKLFIVTSPESGYRYQEIRPDEEFERWKKWYGGQKENEGTVQTYPETGKPYYIDYSGENFSKGTYRVGDENGYVVPDSTRTFKTNSPINYNLKQVQGAVPSEAKRSNENLFYRNGGKLIPRKK